jgi:hypothetical protein
VPAEGIRQSPTQILTTSRKTQKGNQVSREKCHPSGLPRRDQFRQAKPESLHRERELEVQGNPRRLSKRNLQNHLQTLQKHNRRNKMQEEFHQP